ncbi:MAG: MazG-like family protein [bacterium]|nr:MazG-like family protein [Bacillota bacterium]
MSSKPPQGEFDLARNLRTIEWLKAQILEQTSFLFKAMLQGREELILEALAGIIISLFVLTRRLGLSFTRLEKKLLQQVKGNIEADHEVEKWYGDLSALLDYLSGMKR